MNPKKLLSCFFILLALGSHAAEKPLVGAIRWDAWYGDGTGVNGEVEGTLSVQRWQWRAPFFAEVVSTNQVKIRGGAEEIRQEIDFAADAGLDYWAFCLYEPDHNLSRALNLYLDAPNRSRINFCMNLQAGHFGKGGLKKALLRVPLYVEYMQRPEYQTALNGRPLVYLLFPQNFTESHALQNEEEAAQLIQALRDQSLTAGLKNPYVVFQDYFAEAVNELKEKLGADAIGAYAANTGRLKVSAKQFQEYVETEFIPEFLKTGSDVVPLASTGFDMRPRIETGISWDPHAADLDIDMYHEQPTPKEFAGHLKNVLALLKSHPKQTPANTVLIYAWNEFDEGGWLCPTLSEGTARLDALPMANPPERKLKDR